MCFCNKVEWILWLVRTFLLSWVLKNPFNPLSPHLMAHHSPTRTLTSHILKKISLDLCTKCNMGHHIFPIGSPFNDILLVYWILCPLRSALHSWTLNTSIELLCPQLMPHYNQHEHSLPISRKSSPAGSVQEV